MGTVTASQSQGHDVIIGFRPIPPALEKVMRTVDRPPQADSLDVGEYTRRAAGVIGAGERVVHRAFAVASESKDSTTFWFLARLLVRPYEVEQWKPI